MGSSGGNPKNTASTFPVSGLNDNVEFMGKQLHVQTEDAGFPNTRIVTQVFSGGRVVLSRKSDYPPGVRQSGNLGKVRELMHSQHLQIIQELKNKQAKILDSPQTL